MNILWPFSHIKYLQLVQWGSLGRRKIALFTESPGGCTPTLHVNTCNCTREATLLNRTRVWLTNTSAPTLQHYSLWSVTVLQTGLKRLPVLVKKSKKLSNLKGLVIRRVISFILSFQSKAIYIQFTEEAPNHYVVQGTVSKTYLKNTAAAIPGTLVLNQSVVTRALNRAT